MSAESSVCGDDSPVCLRDEHGFVLDVSDTLDHPLYDELQSHKEGVLHYLVPQQKEPNSPPSSSPPSSPFVSAVSSQLVNDDSMQSQSTLSTNELKQPAPLPQLAAVHQEPQQVPQPPPTQPLLPEPLPLPTAEPSQLPLTLSTAEQPQQPPCPQQPQCPQQPPNLPFGSELDLPSLETSVPTTCRGTPATAADSILGEAKVYANKEDEKTWEALQDIARLFDSIPVSTVVANTKPTVHRVCDSTQRSACRVLAQGGHQIGGRLQNSTVNGRVIAQNCEPPSYTLMDYMMYDLPRSLELYTCMVLVAVLFHYYQ